MKYLPISWAWFDISPKLLNEVFEFMTGVNRTFFARMREMVLYRSHDEVQFAGNLIIASILVGEPCDFLLANRQGVPEGQAFGFVTVGRDANDLDGGNIRGGLRTATVDTGPNGVDHAEDSDQ